MFLSCLCRFSQDVQAVRDVRARAFLLADRQTRKRPRRKFSPVITSRLSRDPQYAPHMVNCEIWNILRVNTLAAYLTRVNGYIFYIHTFLALLFRR